MTDANYIVNQGRFLTAALSRATTDLDDSHRGLEPAPGLKTAGWLLGHLAITGDFGRRICNRPPLCPREWRSLFNPGSTPSPNASDYPPMPLLRETLLAVYNDLCDAFPTVDAAAFGAANPFTPALGDYPTAGDFAAYLLTGHLAYHLGQLTAWRAAARLEIAHISRPQPALA